MKPLVYTDAEPKDELCAFNLSTFCAAQPRWYCRGDGERRTNRDLHGHGGYQVMGTAAAEAVLGLE